MLVQVEGGHYADVSPVSRCQVFHVCVVAGPGKLAATLRAVSFLCPNGTLFSQQYSGEPWLVESRSRDHGARLSLVPVPAQCATGGSTWTAPPRSCSTPGPRTAEMEVWMVTEMVAVDMKAAEEAEQTRK